MGTTMEDPCRDGTSGNPAFRLDKATDLRTTLRSRRRHGPQRYVDVERVGVYVGRDAEGALWIAQPVE